MIEAFLIALDLSDEDIYNKLPFYSTVNERLVETDIPYDIAIIGPTLFNVKNQSVYPVFSMWKVNNIDNKHFEPPKKAYLIITQIETNEHTVLTLNNELGKLPYPNKPSKIVYPPGYDKNKRTFSYGKTWRDISQKDISWIDGQYTIQVVCGKMISNIIGVKVSGTGVTAENVVKKIRMNIEPLQEGIKKGLYEKSEYSPNIPEKFGAIEIKNEAGAGNTDNKYVVFGSFKVPASGVGADLTIEMFLILQYSFENGFVHECIYIPAESITNTEGGVTGYFRYDITKHFFNTFTKKTVMPEVVFINALSGNAMSNVVEIRTTQKE